MPGSDGIPSRETEERWGRLVGDLLDGSVISRREAARRLTEFVGEEVSAATLGQWELNEGLKIGPGPYDLERVQDALSVALKRKAGVPLQRMPVLLAEERALHEMYVSLAMRELDALEAGGATREGSTHTMLEQDPGEARYLALCERMDRMRTGGPTRMVESEGMPREGESARAAVARLYREHCARMTLEGKPHLPLATWTEAHKELYPQLHLLAEGEWLGPERAAAANKEAGQRLLDERAAREREEDPGITMAEAVTRAYKKDRTLYDKIARARRGEPLEG